MQTTRRASVLVVGLALSLVGAQLFAQAGRPQRGGMPDPGTPQIVVTTFASTASRQLGYELANEVRSRIQNEHSAKELFAVTKTNIEASLVSAGFPVDSALATNEQLELARTVRGTIVLDGRVVPAANGLHVETRLVTKTAGTTVEQPLPPVDAKDPGDVAILVERNITAAMKQLAPYNACINDLRSQQFEQAIKDGAAAIAAYPNSTLGRICQLQAFKTLDRTDSVIAVADAILARDSSSTQALTHLIDGWQKKGNAEKAINYGVMLWRRDPTGGLVPALIRLAIEVGVAGSALPMIDTLLAANPSDTATLRQRWIALRQLGRYKDAIAAGDALVSVDPTAATVEFYSLQITAAQRDSNNAKILELATLAAQKFPSDVGFVTLQAQQYRKAGQLPEALAAARRAVALEPRSTSTVFLAALTANDLNMIDTAAVIAERGIAAGVDRAVVEPFLWGPAKALIDRAQASQQRADWEAALGVSQKLDATASSQMTKFFVGVSSFSVGYDALKNAQQLGEDRNPKTMRQSRAKACAEAKVTEEMWVTAQTNIVRGGPGNAQGITQVMQLIQQYDNAVPQMKRVYCSGR